MKNKKLYNIKKKKEEVRKRGKKKIKPRKINLASHDSGRVTSLECQAITFLLRLPLFLRLTPLLLFPSPPSSFSSASSSKYLRNIGNNLIILSYHILSPFFVFYALFLSFPLSPNSQEIRPHAFYRRNKR